MSQTLNNSLGLKTKDLRLGMTTIIEKMSQIREEALVNRNLPNAKKDEYLHLTGLLAAGVQSLAQTNETVKRNMQVVAESAGRNPSLIKYDPVQDIYWLASEKPFIESLDSLIVAVEGDKFRMSEEKHHVLQAIKYLWSGDSVEKKEKIYDTILPFQGAVPLETAKAGIFSKITGALFGINLEFQDENGLSLIVEQECKFADDIIKVASERGYRHVKLKVSQDRLNELREKYGSGFLDKNNNLRIQLNDVQRFYTARNKKTYTAELSIQGDARNPLETKEQLTYLEKLGQLWIPETIGPSLIWSDENHHSFGQSLETYVRENSDLKPVNGVGVRTDRKNQAVVYDHCLSNSEGYTLNSSLFFFKDERYLLTVLTKGPNEKYSEKAIEVVKQNSELKQKAEKLFEDKNIRYLRIRKFIANQLISEESDIAEYEITR